MSRIAVMAAAIAGGSLVIASSIEVYKYTIASWKRAQRRNQDDDDDDNSGPPRLLQSGQASRQQAAKDTARPDSQARFTLPRAQLDLARLALQRARLALR